MYKTANKSAIIEFMSIYMPDFDFTKTSLEEINKEVTKCIKNLQKDIYGSEGKSDWHKIGLIRDDELRSKAKINGKLEINRFKKILCEWFQADKEQVNNSTYTEISTALRSAIVNSIYKNFTLKGNEYNYVNY